MNALIVVDVQNDLVPPGALEIPAGDQVVPIINQLQPLFDLVVAAINWYPPNHRKFFTNHPGTRPLQTIEIDGEPQLLWPSHCIAGTRGADFVQGLNLTRITKVFHQGINPDVDSASAFYDQGKRRSTGLPEFLKSKEVTDVYIAGLATNFGIRATAIDSVALGFKTAVIVDATRGINFRPDDVVNAVADIERSGAAIVLSNVLLGT